jgi:hypothetical protein
MAEEKESKTKGTLKKTEEVIEKDVKKGWGAIKGAGKKVKEGVEGEDKKEEKKEEEK